MITEHKYCIAFLLLVCSRRKIFHCSFFFLHTLHCSLIILTQVYNHKTRSKQTARIYKNVKRTRFSPSGLLIGFPDSKKCSSKSVIRATRIQDPLTVPDKPTTVCCMLWLFHMLLFFSLEELCKTTL